MQYANQTASISNCLLVPYNRLARTFAFIDSPVGIFFHPESFVGFGNREDEEERTSRTGNECEEVGVVDGEDVMKRESGGETKCVDQRGHDFGVVFYDLEVRRV
jgi:hypothetical protein